MSWFAAALDLVRLVETESGVVAVGAGGDPAPAPAGHALGSIEQHIQSHLGASTWAEASAQVGDLIERARQGQRGCIQLGRDRHGPRILAGPVAGGHVEIVIAGGEPPVSAEVQRRAAVSDMAAAVSHEVSNALSAISGWTELMRESPGDTEAQRDTLGRIGRCAKVAQTIARRLLDAVGEQGEGNREDVDVTELAREVGDLLQLSARAARVELVVEVAGPAVVRGVRADLVSAIWNLVKNAIEACAEGDRVTLRVRPVEGDVTIEVSDNGPGMDVGTLERAFTPYFTTKSAGTGLGLSLVKRAATAMGGHVALDSELGRGTRFVVTLPKAGRHSDTYPPVSLRVPRSTVAGQPLSGIRVLVIDDDDALSDMVATALELKGAEVTACRGAAGAGELSGRYDIALIDMILRDGRGDELLASLRQRGIVGAALLVTGLVSRPRLVAGGEPDDWVRKPFEMGPLIDRVRQTLERHRMLSSVTAVHGG